MSDLVKRLRIKAGMIEMGELIAWGSDSALMQEAADALEMAAPAAQGEPVGYVSPRLLKSLRSGKACGITMEDKPDVRNGVTIPLFTAELQPDAVQVEVVGWQFYQDGKWWNGTERSKDHKKNTLEAGFRVRDLYAAPQPAVQQPVPEIIKTVADFVGSQKGGPFTPAVIKAAILGQLEYGDAFTKLFTSPASKQPAPAVQGDLVAWATRLYNTAYHAGHHDTVEGCYTHVYPQDMGSHHEDVVQEWLADNPQPAPEVAMLVEALSRCLHQASYSIGCEDALSIQLERVRDIANEALAAHHKTEQVQEQ